MFVGKDVVAVFFSQIASGNANTTIVVFVANLFHREINERKKRPSVFDARKVLIQKPREGGQLSVTRTEVNCLAPLSMLMECGIYSGHPYQPDVNHRKCDYVSLYETTVDDSGTKPPLMSSMVRPTEATSFSVGPPICFYVYEIVDCTGNSDLMNESNQLFSANSMNVKYDSGVMLDGVGTVLNRHSKSVTGKCFARALEFFGLERHKINADGNSVK